MLSTELNQSPVINKPTIEVVAGILSNGAGQYLIAKRRAHQDQGGLWEFPGGKREAGEASLVALSRELAEELSIVVVKARFFLSQSHDYSSKRVNLQFFQVLEWRGEAQGAEGQEILWVDSKRLAEFRFPPANFAVVNRLTRAAPTNRNTANRTEYLS